jgi:hypothetical protein
MKFVRRFLASLLSVLAPLPAQAEQREMVSWVVLSNTPLKLAEEELRATLAEIFPGAFQPGEQTNFVIDGPTPGTQFLIQSNIPDSAGMFMLMNIPGSYTRFSGFARRIADAAMRAEAMSQKAWISVDSINSHGNRENGYRFIGRVLARLAPADAAFLVHPSRLTTVRFDDGVRRRLASGEQIP